MLRHDIFYWKCDSNISFENKRTLFFEDKYDKPGAREAFREIAGSFLGHAPESLRELRAAGNHLTYEISDSGKTWLLRADDGIGDDDYLFAESAVMNLLNERGMPVPRVYETDISKKKYPFRWQIMEFVRYPNLNKFYKAGTLDASAIAEQSGKFLAELHSVRLDGFGFLNTDTLQKDGSFEGIDCSCADYFNKRLESHLAYLEEHSPFSADYINRIREIFEREIQSLSAVEKGSLLHRDYAYWNILGTENELKYVIDWDDCVVGDPADDFGIINCFLGRPLLELCLKSYSSVHRVDEDFLRRIHLHTLRNMLWKYMIRDCMGYFERGNDFFLTGAGNMSLHDYTLLKMTASLEALEK